MVQASQPETDSSTPYTEMELFVREQHSGERDFRIAYRMGPNASAGVAEVYGNNVGITPNVARALAHLMAASPKLLKALELAIPLVESLIDQGHVKVRGIETGPALDVIRAAIEQAQS